MDWHLGSDTDPLNDDQDMSVKGNGHDLQPESKLKTAFQMSIFWYFLDSRRFF